MPFTNLTDKLNRPIHDLRISVIDRCNFRCPYCMPEKEFSKHYQFLQENEWLSFDEITRLTNIFISLGVKKVRLTGGEPLLRPDIDHLIQRLSDIDGIDDLALTTNGSLLTKYARKLKQAGLHRLTISLDTLNPETFRIMSGQKGNLEQTLNGIQSAIEAGFISLKLNVVVQKGINDGQIMDLVRRFKGSGHVLRFIEYMDVGNCNHWNLNDVKPSIEILQLIQKHFPVEALDEQYFGEVAKRYRFKDDLTEIGFVSSVTQPFCHSCTRSRLSTNGLMITCLFAEQGPDLRTHLRNGASDQELSKMIQTIWTNREDRYSELRHDFLKAHQERHKVEMFQIGG